MKPYVADPFRPVRRRTREVRVGDVGLGGANPIRVQSMTTTDTRDVVATAAQIERLADAGCEIARITVPSIREAECLPALRAELERLGVSIPLVADIHFTPNAALIAADHVEKVRINPGNYADKKRFEVREYSDAEYGEELARVAERFLPLVERCRENGRAMRIGTNHGSLSDRILNRFGDTPRGMVESALEFLDVCEAHDFRDIVFSMKASNPQVAIQAYRLLAARLEERAPGAPSYPFHVGVTEAGDGVDGRVKSAIGIGALLEDGLGDTVRVSLTEDPVREIPVAQALARPYAEFPENAHGVAFGTPFVANFYEHARRETLPVRCGDIELGGEHPVRAEIDLGAMPENPQLAAEEWKNALARVDSLACEGIHVSARDVHDLARAERLRAALAPLPLIVRATAEWVLASEPAADRLAIAVEEPSTALRRVAEFAASRKILVEWSVRVDNVNQMAGRVDAVLEAVEGLEVAQLFSVQAPQPVHATRALVSCLRARSCAAPILLRGAWPSGLDEDERVTRAATTVGALLCDGIGDAVVLGPIDAPARGIDCVYRILQGARQRTSWTEFISCPSCGRTLFDLEETTERIKSRTGHLKGVKIAIMGCIVNGPGEMADADFGYVGSGPGRVNLYVGKDVVLRNVAEAEADDRLVDLIRDHDRWIDPV